MKYKSPKRTEGDKGERSLAAIKLVIYDFYPLKQVLTAPIAKNQFLLLTKL